MMTPEERQLLSGLFERIRNSAAQPRDAEAESFIADAVRAQPYAPYLLTQTVLVQDQALRAANERLQQLEARVNELQSASAPAQGSGSFLGNLGKSLFGAPAAQQSGAPAPPRPSAPYAGPWGSAAPPQQAYGQPQAYAPAAPSYPGAQGAWGAAPPAQGGGFLHGALGAAAGVAGGVLLADSIRGLFGNQGSPFGIGSGFGGSGLGGAGMGGGETIVNNYYGDSPDQTADPTQSADFGPSDSGSGLQDAGYDPSSGGDDSSDWGGGDDGAGGDGGIDV